MNGFKHSNLVVLVIALVALSFSASAGYYTGYVVDSSNTGISGANVFLYNASDGSNAATVSTDAAGLFNFTSVSNGTYKLNASATGFSNTSENSIPAMPTFSGGVWRDGLVLSFNITLTALVPGWITGTVKDSTGTGVSGANVSALLQSTLKNSTLTDATGFYNFTILDGSYTVSASKTNYTSPSSTPSVVAPSAATNLNFTMLKYPGLNGTILNSTNAIQVLSGASIALSQSGVTKYSASTNSS